MAKWRSGRLQGRYPETYALIDKAKWASEMAAERTTYADPNVAVLLLLFLTKQQLPHTNAAEVVPETSCLRLQCSYSDDAGILGHYFDVTTRCENHEMSPRICDTPVAVAMVGATTTSSQPRKSPRPSSKCQ